MSLIAAVVTVVGGIDQSLAAAAAGGDHFTNDGRKIFIVDNTSGGALTVTFDSPNADNFGVINAAHDIVQSVPAGETHYFGPFNKGRFNDGSGFVQVTYSSETGLNIGVLEFAGDA